MLERARPWCGPRGESAALFALATERSDGGRWDSFVRDAADIVDDVQGQFGRWYQVRQRIEGEGGRANMLT